MTIVRRNLNWLLVLLAGAVVSGPLATSALAQASQPLSAVTASEEPDYVLGSGDKVRVTVYGEESLSGEFQVGSSGQVALPLIGEVKGAGLNIKQFQEAVQKTLSDGYLKDPRVSVEVLTFRPFYILGEVTKPGTYPYTSGLTVLNAVATAGGFTYRAEKRQVFVKHKNESSESKLPLDPATPVAPGDTIRIGERFF
jgi:protein involved in polysaccharide export with SLBB domain